MKQRPKYRNNETNQLNSTELSSIRTASPATIEMAVTEGDTLQALSIRYHCPVAELKRLNQLHRENEIHARRTIKIPYRALTMVAVHRSGDNSPETKPMKNSTVIDAHLLKQKLTSAAIETKEEDFNQIIFNTRLDPGELDGKEEELEADEEVQLLPNESVTKVRSNFSCNGADWGLSWPVVFILILIVVFVGPIVYILYIAEHPTLYHHHR